MLSLRSYLSSTHPPAVLLRQVLLFVAVDAVYLSFSTAYAFSHAGTRGALLYLAAQYLVSAAAFIGCFALMHREALTSAQSLRLGSIGMLVGMLAAGALPEGEAGLLALVLAGGARGLAWAGRQWLELHHTKGSEREAYVSLLQTATTLFRLVGPLAAAALLVFSSESFQLLFLGLGSAGLVVSLFMGRARGLTAPAPGPVRPLQTLVSREYWQTAPFYVLEGAGSSLRQALYVSGTLMVVGTVSRFGIVDSLASAAAAGFLAWQSTRPQPGPSLARLRFSLCLVGLSWLVLLAALKLSWLMPVFIAAYALGNPLLQSVKASLVLKGSSMAGTAAHDAAMARELLLLTARLGALTLAAALASPDVTPAVGLALVTGLAVALLPLEYRFATGLAQRSV